MLNNINDTTFKANFRVTAPVKDAARLKNIQRIFSENTAQITDTLSLSKIEDFGLPECFYVGSKPEKSNVVAFMDSFLTPELWNDFLITKLQQSLLKLSNQSKHLIKEMELCLLLIGIHTELNTNKEEI